ncbi:hypothetical protein [Methanorbis rubei]|uniref:Uncharacterized protein n=1 Tax=Methanorbis rubei TaxID=3028300 RepID=A0AAE4SE21_9EURY|nr:hypothetical protein [Methanocorpusculaceae archaeon Cs1]
MQEMESREKPEKATVTISVTPRVKETLCSLKRGNESYSEILEPILYTVAVSESDEGIGAVFLKSVYVNDDLKKLKKPIPLKVIIEDNTLILSNSEFKILVTCIDIIEGLEEARLQFADLIDIYTDHQPMTEGAVTFGKKLMDAVWA